MVPLTILYNKSIDTGTIPHDWGRANVTPIFEKMNKHTVENYRPVSLTSVPCKVITKKGVDYSQWTEVVSSVPQGSVIGPKLFLVFINDLTDGLKSNIGLFPDDAKSCLEEENQTDANVLQQDLIGHYKQYKKATKFQPE